MPAIECKNVTKIFRIPHEPIRSVKDSLVSIFARKQYEQFFAVKNLSLSVEHGEFLSIIGSNGCGKSTLLKLIAGIYVPTQGSILVDGKMSPFLELGVGFNGDLTARENIFLYGAVLGLSRRQVKDRFDQIVEFSELEKFLDTRLRNYSSGMYVRLAFATAIQSDAPIFLFDEVLAVGDARFQEKCFRLFDKMREAGKTIVFVTHDLTTVSKLSDRVVWLDRGCMVLEGSPDTVVPAYKKATAL